ncbi:MAG: hypothetical protein IJX53_00430 [Clostridia bacterium]|nr:hypothetical protein [Clostridia bacterium]
MTGKQKCNILRQIRRDIAAANQLDYNERDCTHTGDCRGTCPYCEAQLKRLEGELAQRRSLGQRIAVMGLSMGLLATNLSSCDNPFSRGTTLQGAMMPESTGTEQTETATAIPGELIAAETTTEPPMTAEMGVLPIPEPLQGEPAVETLMGDIALPVPETETTALETAIAGGIGPTPDLPDPDEVREAVTVAVTEPRKNP